MGRKVTSMDVDDDLWNEFKIEALRRKVPLKVLLEEAIKAELARARGKGR